MDGRWEVKPTMVGIFQRIMAPWSPISTVLQPVILLINRFPHVWLDAKHWEQSTFYYQFQVRRGRTKHSAKAVMKLEIGSSKGLHENEVQQGAQHFSPFPGSWHNICQRLKVALCSVDCLKSRYRPGPTQSLSAASYSAGTGEKTTSLLVWSWRGEWKTFQGIAEGSMGTTRALWQYRSRSWCLESGRLREDWPRGPRMVR